jgi:hypothetical protein
MEIRALSSQSKNRKTFYTKVFPLFKNGQKKCPKTKTRNTFGKKKLQKLLPRFPFSDTLFIKCHGKCSKTPTSTIHTTP